MILGVLLLAVSFVYQKDWLKTVGSAPQTMEAPGVDEAADSFLPCAASPRSIKSLAVQCASIFGTRAT